MKKWTGVVVVLLAMVSVAGAEWFYGVGTGLKRLNAKGDVGIDTRLVGGVVFDLDLDPDDFSDLMETAFGLGAFATDGTWTIKGSGGFLELTGDAAQALPAGGTIAGEFTQEISVAELSVAYTVLREKNVVVSPFVGVRHIKHEYELGATLTPAGGGAPTTAARDADWNWTDARLGVNVDVPINQEWTWGSSAEVAFGGSEGSYKVNTGVAWRFATHWLARLDFDYFAIDYENGDVGDGDYYLYDVDEFGTGLSAMYTW